MPTIMTKYKFNNKDYLIYDQQLLDVDFNPAEWGILANPQYGVGADEIIVLTLGQAHGYNALGNSIALSEDAQAVLLHHHKPFISNHNIRKIEVRFTNAYIKQLLESKPANEYIA